MNERRHQSAEPMPADILVEHLDERDRGLFNEYDGVVKALVGSWPKPAEGIEALQLFDGNGEFDQFPDSVKTLLRKKWIGSPESVSETKNDGHDIEDEQEYDPTMSGLAELAAEAENAPMAKENVVSGLDLEAEAKKERPKLKLFERYTLAKDVNGDVRLVENGYAWNRQKGEYEPYKFPPLSGVEIPAELKERIEEKGMQEAILEYAGKLRSHWTELPPFIVFDVNREGGESHRLKWMYTFDKDQDKFTKAYLDMGNENWSATNKKARVKDALSLPPNVYREIEPLLDRLAETRVKEEKKKIGSEIRNSPLYKSWYYKALLSAEDSIISQYLGQQGFEDMPRTEDNEIAEYSYPESRQKVSVSAPKTPEAETPEEIEIKTQPESGNRPLDAKEIAIEMLRAAGIDVPEDDETGTELAVREEQVMEDAAEVAKTVIPAILEINKEDTLKNQVKKSVERTSEILANRYVRSGLIPEDMVGSFGRHYADQLIKVVSHEFRNSGFFKEVKLETEDMETEIDSQVRSLVDDAVKESGVGYDAEKVAVLSEAVAKSLRKDKNWGTVSTDRESGKMVFRNRVSIIERIAERYRKLTGNGK